MPGCEPTTRELSACAVLAGRFPHRVLLAVPDVRHIPTFALAAEKGRASFEWAKLAPADTLLAVAGRDAAEGLQEGRYGAYRLIDTRTRLDRQTALYALWCVFTTADHAEAFERDHPHLGLSALCARVEANLRQAQAVGGEKPQASTEVTRSQMNALARLRQLSAIANGKQVGSEVRACTA